MAQKEDQPNEENVINILVIKESSNWDKSVSQLGLASGGSQNSVYETRPAIKRDALSLNSSSSCYKSQSFVINSSQCPGIHAPSLSLSDIDTIGLELDVFRNVPNADQIHFDDQSTGEDFNACMNNKVVKPAASRHILHKSHSFPASDDSQLTCVQKVFPKASVSDVSPQLFSSQTLFSPALLSGRDAGKESETPKISTTPDSGFCTPSLSESSSVNAFFTSTPKRSPGPKSSTPVSSETPRGRVDALHQRFSDLYNSIDWDSLDESCDLSEDPKGDTNDECSPNSSLKSVQWLKSFSVCDSGIPTLSSPPTHKDTTSLQIQSETSEKGQSSQTGSAEASTSRFIPCPSPITSSCTVSSSSASSLYPSPLLTPLPVIMAPKFPTYLQNHPAVSSQTSTQPSKPQEGTRRKSRRKALEELKMNRGERPVGRPKNMGKLFPRPGYSYMDLIKLALQSSETGELMLTEIIAWIQDHFPYYKHEASDNFKSLIRHNLSLHSAFVKADNKKHKCKWKLCKDAKIPHKIHVPAPPEPNSLQQAFLDRAKRSGPQPILPKVNTYALVPIHNLANPVSESHQQVGPTLTTRKPVHILPKQAEDTQVRMQAQPDQFYYDPSLQTLSAVQQPLQTGSQTNSSICVDPSSSVLSHIDTNTQLIPLLQNSNPSFSSALTSKQGPCDIQMVPADNTVDVADLNVLNNQYLDEISCVHTSSSRSDISQAQSNYPSKNPFFPLDSVVEIRQEQGTKPGEKKIILVLQDPKNSKQKNKQVQLKTKQVFGFQDSNPGGFSVSQDASLNAGQGLKNPSLGKKRPIDGKNSCLGIKNSKGGQRNRKARGPVLNLQSMLEDKRASDAIGQLLLEEDEGLNQELKKVSEAMDINLCMDNNTLDQCCPVRDEQMPSVVDNSWVVKKPCQGDNACSKPSPSFSCSSGKRVSQRERMNIMKNRPLNFSQSFDSSLIRSNDSSQMCSSASASTMTSIKIPAASRRILRHCSSGDQSSQVSASSSLSASCGTPCASHLVFPRLSSGEHSSSSCSSFTNSSSSASIGLSSVVVSNTETERDRMNSRQFSQSKSRRKQVHMPLTNEVSPLRNVSSWCNNFEGVVKGNTYNSEKCGSYQDSFLAVTPASLSTEIQQPSLEILQHKPLEHTPQERSSCYNAAPLTDFPHSLDQIQPSDMSKCIEHIFSLGSPMKDKTPVSLSINSDTDNGLGQLDFETPPSLHFFSTFAQEVDSSSSDSFLQSSPLSHSSGKRVQQQSKTAFSDSTTSFQDGFQHPSLSCEPNVYSYGDYRTSQASQKRVCLQGSNKGYDVLNGKTWDLNSRSTSAKWQVPIIDTPPCGGGRSTAVNTASIDTPPCGATLRPVASRSLDVANGSSACLPPKRLNEDPVGLHLSTSSILDKEQPPSFFFHTTSVHSNVLLSPGAATHSTPPCGTTPLFMSTPSHLSHSPSAVNPPQEFFPFGDSLSGVLDNSFMDHLDSYINSLQNHGTDN